MKRIPSELLLLLTLSIASCSPPPQEPKSALPAPVPVAPAPVAEAPPAPPAYQSALPVDLRQLVDMPFKGDFDAMVHRRIIRIGAPFNRTFYFVDHGVQRGLSYEYAELFENDLNKRLKTGNLKIHVVMLPMARDQLIPQLQLGKIDMAVAQLTITPERRKLVDFTAPTRPNVNEVLVTGPGAAPVRTFEDIKDKVFVRKSSSYYASLLAYNRARAAKGLLSIDIEAAPENLEDDDLLEMVNAGLLPATIVDNYLAEYWKNVFPNLNVHSDLTFRTGADLAVAIRKDSPQLAAELNHFIAKNGLRSAIGAVLSKRYLRSYDYVKNAASEAERKKFLDLVALFRKYGDQYDFDYLLMAAQGYQESRLNQNAKSRVGAIGVMQLMPATGKEQNVGDIRLIEPNIHAGVKYMRFVRDQYFANEPMDNINKELFTFASYNAGAGRIRQLRREAAARGLNPNVWFGNVERIASERIGRETVTYVSNIYKYYIAYRLIAEQQRQRLSAKAEMEARSKK